MAAWAEMWGFICIVSLTGIKHLGNTLLRVSIACLPFQRRLTVEGEAHPERGQRHPIRQDPRLQNGKKSAE